MKVYLMPLLASCLFACGATGPDDQGSDNLAPGPDSDRVLGRSRVQHFNHWAPASSGGMNQPIGSGQFYGNCANWGLWDMFPGDAGAYGFHEYATRSATTTHDGVDVPYSGSSWDVSDGYAGNPIVADRLNQLLNAQSWWIGQDYWTNIVGWNGSVYANTASRSHGAGHCTGTFVLTFDADPNYSLGQYFITTALEANITDAAACTSTDPAAVPWTAMDVYVKECRVSDGACFDRIGAFQSKISGTWNQYTQQCDTWASVIYAPPLGFRALWVNVVASAGVGHVPSAAKIYVSRWN
jgi:hypothetical protein